MNAVYHIYPDSAIVAYNVTGDAYNNAISADYDAHGGYPVAAHGNATDAIAHRAALGAAWFGLESLPPITEAEIEEVF